MTNLKEEVDQLIEKTKAEFDGQDTVAFLGESSSGKTVVAAVFNYHLENFWIPQTKGNWESTPVTGQEIFNKIIRGMKKGEFTSSTPINEYPSLVRDIFSLEGEPNKKQLTLHDISGETYVDLLSKEYEDNDQRVKKILDGDGAYIAWAKQYVIIVGCDLHESWDTDEPKVANMIRNILLIKQRIHNFDDKTIIRVPIAVVFTKSDMLKASDKAKSPEKLLEDYPALRSALNAQHDKTQLKCFKVHVESTKETKADVLKRIKEAEANSSAKYNEKMDSLKQQLKPMIENSVKSAETEARKDPNVNEESIKNIKEKAKQKTINQYQTIINNLKPDLVDKKLDLSWRVNKPFSYSESEYSRLISWIIGKKSDE